MPARNSKGHFVKRSRKRARKSVAIARASTRTVYRTRSAPKRRYRRRGAARGASMTSLLHIGGAAAGLAYLTGPSGVATIRDNASKIPGAKTFGPGAALGLACLAVDRFVKPNKWLKLAGIAGVVLAASQVGQKGSDFKWVGDDVADLDVGDDDDAADFDDDEE